MLVHHIFFWLKNPESAEDREKLLNGLKELTKIKEISTVHIGTPADTDRPVIDRTYSFSLLEIFENMEKHDTYQVHPIHKEFIKNHSHLWSKVVIYDSLDV